LRVHRRLGNLFDVAWDLHLVGAVEMKLDRFEAARSHLNEALALFREANDLSGFALVASDLGELAAAEGQAERQATLVGIADTFARRSGTGLVENFAAEEGRSLPKDISAELRPALERGLAMDEATALRYALGEREISRD
jgi:hypothetical protein